MFYTFSNLVTNGDGRKLMVRFILVLSFVVWEALTVWAQNTNSAARPDRGLAPGNSYSISDIENINLTNGNVSLSIPLATLPPIAGGKLSWTIYASYNSKVWDMKRKDRLQGNPSVQARFMEEIPQVSDISGWRIGGAYSIESRESRDDVDWMNLAGDPDEMFLAQNISWLKFSLTTPDGATHELRPLDYQAYVGNKLNLQGYYKDTPSTTNIPMRYYSYDGSYLWAIVYPAGPIVWELYLS